MKLSIPFAELQDYVSTHYHIELKLSYIDGSIVEVAKPIKVLGFSKQIGIQLSVKGIEGTNLLLSCDGNMGIGLLVKFAVPFFKRFFPEKMEMVQMLPGNIIKISLGEIDQVKKAFEVLILQNISFEPSCLVIEAKLR